MSSVYDNRELSWLKFNERVLEEAIDKNNPLLERLTFFSIFQTNLDEFFMVRVGSLFEQLHINSKNYDDKTHRTVKELLELIFEKVRCLENIRDREFEKILKEMQKRKIEYVTPENTTPADSEFLRKYFKKEIKPFLVPTVLNKSTPFPFLNQKLLYICADISSGDKVRMGMVPVDENIKRFIQLPSHFGKLRFALAEDLILFYAESVFKNYSVQSKTLLKLTRNADLDVDEASFDHDIDYREFMGDLLKKRKKQAPVRVVLSKPFSPEILEFMSAKLPLKTGEKQIFHTYSPLDFSWVFSIKGISKKDTLFFPKFSPAQSASINIANSILPQIRKNDILLSYPYESMKPFIKMLEEVAADKYVKSIKITLYRLAKNSKVIDALVNAVENGKEVTVLVELRARFDEENNIGWSRKLEHAGCKVIYGPAEYKVHSKLLLITRKTDKGKPEYFTQIGTGNYNEKTSTLYTDFSLLTANEEIGKDAEKLFKLLTKDVVITPTVSGFDGKNVNDTVKDIVENSKKIITIKNDNHTISILDPETEPSWTHLLISPLNLRSSIIELIDIEIAKAKSGETAYVGAKLNSLTDKLIIDKMTEASKAGVEVQLIVRGICCLIPGITGETENVSVTSVVGRFLEHSRIYIFGKDEDCKMYISSADYMTRNTIRRIEVAAPILSPVLRQRINSMFNIILSDNVKGRYMNSDGNYIKKEKDDSELAVNSQDIFSTAKTVEL
jgi:polyphosphate kinase